MSTSITKHRCNGIRLQSYLPEINNAVIFVVEVEGANFREDLEITLFGLSDAKARRLADAISEIEEMSDE